MNIENVVLHARRSAEERNRLARSFGGGKNKIARRFRRKGIRLLVVLDGMELNIPVSNKSIKREAKY